MQLVFVYLAAIRDLNTFRGYRTIFAERVGFFGNKIAEMAGFIKRLHNFSIAEDTSGVKKDANFEGTCDKKPLTNKFNYCYNLLFCLTLVGVCDILHLVRWTENAKNFS